MQFAPPLLQQDREDDISPRQEFTRGWCSCSLKDLLWFSKERENMLCVVSGLEVGGVSFIVQCVFSVNGD